MSGMVKEASLVDLEFDGETVLCRVCGDKSSGFHYGVHACEGCKGFFRRSIQQKIQYRSCLKNQQCNIMRVNRNRCQYCRLKKCISVGMSRDAVRFGRVPKKEKARIIEQMQKVNSNSHTTALCTLLQNEQEVVHTVVHAHQMTSDLSLSRVLHMRSMALNNGGGYVNCPANMACPLNDDSTRSAIQNGIEEFSECFTPSIKSVVDFAKGIPGFTLLNQDDQLTLLKAGAFEVLLVRLVCLFDSGTDTMMFTNGKLFQRHPSNLTSGAGFLLDSMFDFAKRFNKLGLHDDELAMFSAVVLLSPDRPGLRNVDQVERIQNCLTQALKNVITVNHKEESTFFAKLLMKTTDLRTLSTLHSEKSIGSNLSQFERKEAHVKEGLGGVDVQDTTCSVSGYSSLTSSDVSADAAARSDSLSDTCSQDSGSNVTLRSQSVPQDATANQQVVLRTPYGTFYREEVNGFYSLVTSEPPRWRCNTLDRDTVSRPRMHTVDEGNRRRYTLDRDHINRMINRLSDKLEKRTDIRADVTAHNSSVSSSPLQEEFGCHSSFVPISAAVQRADELMATDAVKDPRMASTGLLAPFPVDEYQDRRRSYSFHLNSQGHASRVKMPKMIDGHCGDVVAGSQHLPSAQTTCRRSSVGTVSGLHASKRSCPLVSRTQPHRLVTVDGMGGNSTEKASWIALPAFEQGIHETPVFAMMEDFYKTHVSISDTLTSACPAVPFSSSSFVQSLASDHSFQRGGFNNSKSSPGLTSKTETSHSQSSVIGKDDAVSAIIKSEDPVSGSIPFASLCRQQDGERHSESFGHKKFDKFRRMSSSAWTIGKGEIVNTSPLSRGLVEKVDSSNERGHRRCDMMSVDDGSVSVPSTAVCNDDVTKNSLPAKPWSAKDTHPNILAHLSVPSTSSSGHGPVVCCAVCSEEKFLMDANARDQFHTSTVFSLKEKLRRKCESVRCPLTRTATSVNICPSNMVMKDAKVSLSDVHPIQSCLSHVSVSTMDFPVFSSNVSLPCESSKSCHRTQNYFYDGNIVTASSYSNHDLPQHQLNFLSVVPLSGRDNVFEICDSKLSFTTSSNTHHLPMDYTASDMIRKVHKPDHDAFPLNLSAKPLNNGMGVGNDPNVTCNHVFVKGIFTNAST